MVKPVRTAAFLVIMVAAIVLGIRASYLNVQGRPEFATSVAFGVTVVLLLNLFIFPPALRPPRPPAVTVIPLPPPPLPPRWWNGPARVLIVLFWLARSALAGYAAFYVSQELDRGFNLRLLEFAVAGQLLYHLRGVLQRLAGFRLDWSGYRGGAGVRKLVNAVVTVVLAGYSFVVAAFLGDVITAIPRGIYRGLDSLWHLPWLNVPIVVVASVVAFVILAAVVSWVQGRIARWLGPDSALGAKLDGLRVFKWERG